MQTKQLINKQLEDSLSQYDQWKLDPHAVPSVAGAYLEILAPAIERYVDGLASPEKDVIELIVGGISFKNIAKLRKIRAMNVMLEDIHQYEWEFRKWMFRICLQQLFNFCPFCHSGPRWSGTSPHPKVNGSVCDHQARWWAEEMKEGKE